MSRRRPCLLPIMAAIFLVASPKASADTIHLKNGRVIHTALARVAGGEVIFTQYGGRQTIPLAIVERVVSDQRVGPAPIARSGPIEERLRRGPTNPSVEAPATAASHPLPDGIAGLIAPQSISALSGLLGVDSGAVSGLLGSIGTEIEGLDRLLPVLPRLIAAFQRPLESNNGEPAMLDELLGALSQLGVTRADIAARAREYGLPEEWLERF